jgi:hypothetical protein
VYEQLDTTEQREKFREERKRLSENHFNRANTIGAWLLATLAATNLAAAAAVLAFAKGGPASAASSAFAFVAGVIAAILSGFVASIEAGLRSRLYYLESYGEERLTAEGLKHLKRAKWWAPRLSWTGRLLNGLSLLAFIIGAVWIAKSISS